MIKNDIEINAETIYHLLLDNCEWSIRQIEEITGYEERMIILAIGWLAKEDKIRFFEKDETIHIELAHRHSEMFF